MTPHRTREWQVQELVIRADNQVITLKAPTWWSTSKAEHWKNFRRDLNLAMDEAAEYTFGETSNSSIVAK